MSFHIFISQGPPTTPPIHSGDHLIDLDNHVHYLSIDTTSAADWIAIGSQADIIDLQNDKEDKANKAAANGYAPLDGGGLVPVANLPVVIPAPVASVFGRIGAVVSVSNDYNADQIDDSGTTNKFAVQAELDQIGINATNIGNNDLDITDLQTDKEDKTSKGIANGYAPLDGLGVVPASNLPAVIPAPVTSVFGRVGLVGAANNDYNADQIDDAATTNKFATQAELDLIGTNSSNITTLQTDKEDKTNKGIVNGYAPLNGSSVVPDVNLPSNLERTSNKGIANGYTPLDGSSLVPLIHLPVYGSQYTHQESDTPIVLDTGGAYVTVDSMLTGVLPIGVYRCFVEFNHGARINRECFNQIVLSGGVSYTSPNIRFFVSNNDEMRSSTVTHNFTLVSASTVTVALQSYMTGGPAADSIHRYFEIYRVG